MNHDFATLDVTIKTGRQRTSRVFNTFLSTHHMSTGLFWHIVWVWQQDRRRLLTDVLATFPQHAASSCQLRCVISSSFRTMFLLRVQAQLCACSVGRVCITPTPVAWCGNDRAASLKLLQSRLSRSRHAPASQPLPASSPQSPEDRHSGVVPRERPQPLQALRQRKGDAIAFQEAEWRTQRGPRRWVAQRFLSRGSI